MKKPALEVQRNRSHCVDVLVNENGSRSLLAQVRLNEYLECWQFVYVRSINAPVNIPQDGMVLVEPYRGLKVGVHVNYDAMGKYYAVVTVA